MTQHFLTLSMKNRFSFTCPIFDASVEMRGCVLVRDKVYRGEQFPERKGCQACISSSKCPAAAIVQQMAFNRSDATDHCSSIEPKSGKLPASALEAVRPVIVTASDVQRYGLTSTELSLIESANGRIDTQLATAPSERVSGRIQASEAPKRARATKVAPEASTEAPSIAVTSAAASGDMSAAINAAA